MKHGHGKQSSPFGTGANGWENIKIENYLEAASAWASVSNFGRTRRDGKFNDNCCNQSANFLYTGKFTNKNNLK